jgi:hypothetical protein
MGSRFFLNSYAMFRQVLTQQSRGFATSNVAVEGFTGSVGNTPLVGHPKNVKRTLTLYMRRSILRHSQSKRDAKSTGKPNSKTPEAALKIVPPSAYFRMQRIRAGE